VHYDNPRSRPICPEVCFFAVHKICRTFGAMRPPAPRSVVGVIPDEQWQNVSSLAEAISVILKNGSSKHVAALCSLRWLRHVVTLLTQERRSISSLGKRTFIVISRRLAPCLASTLAFRRTDALFRRQRLYCRSVATDAMKRVWASQNSFIHSFYTVSQKRFPPLNSL